MKKSLVLALAIICFTVTQAQKLIPAKVPTAAKDAFAKAHASTTAQWEKEGSNYEVNFKEGNKSMSCVITATGEIVETETGMKLSELPTDAKKYIAQHYKGVKVTEAASITKNDGTVVYEAEIKGKDVLFDANGKMLPAKKGND